METLKLTRAALKPELRLKYLYVSIFSNELRGNARLFFSYLVWKL